MSQLQLEGLIAGYEVSLYVSLHIYLTSSLFAVSVKPCGFGIATSILACSTGGSDVECRMAADELVMPLLISPCSSVVVSADA
jgi:hypothetical protein